MDKTYDVVQTRVRESARARSNTASRTSALRWTLLLIAIVIGLAVIAAFAYFGQPPLSLPRVAMSSRTFD